MSLLSRFGKAFSVAVFFGLTLAPVDGPSAGIALAGDPQPHRAARASVAVAGIPLAGGVAPAAGAVAGASPNKGAITAEVPPGGTQGPCASGMVLVDGEYCPDAEQVCLKWLDPPPYQNLRCGEYAKPAKCKGERKHRRFCIDREEIAEPAAAARGSDAKEPLPLVSKSWLEAKALCEGRGARLCKETEWEFACEGPEMSPYPYGFTRDSTACNIDRTDLGGVGDKLRDHRAPASAFPQCTSAFGAHDLTGNVDEWVEREGVAAPNRSALRGGWWLPGRNRCRAATLHHGEEYSAKQVGFRCCADAPAAAPPAPAAR